MAGTWPISTTRRLPLLARTCILWLLAPLVPGAQAMAQDLGTRIDLELRGVVGENCGIAIADSDEINLLSATGQTATLTLSCNVPFVLEAEAAFGELRNVDSFVADDPHTHVRYEILWPAIFDSFGGMVAENFSADGEAWADGLIFSSAAPSINQRGPFQVQWGELEQLVAGQYHERITITISPNL